MTFRRIVLVAAGLSLAATLVACGDDGAGVRDDRGTPSTQSTPSTPRSYSDY